VADRLGIGHEGQLKRVASLRVRDIKHVLKLLPRFSGPFPSSLVPFGFPGGPYWSKWLRELAEPKVTNAV
jgi:hypothetical protein